MGMAAGSVPLAKFSDATGHSRRPRRIQVRCCARGGREETVLVPLGDDFDVDANTVSDLLEVVQRRARVVPASDLEDLELDDAAGGRLFPADKVSRVLQEGDRLICRSSRFAQPSAAGGAGCRRPRNSSTWPQEAAGPEDDHAFNTRMWEKYKGQWEDSQRERCEGGVGATASQEQAKEKEGGPAPKSKGKSANYHGPVPTTPARAKAIVEKAKAIVEKAKKFIVAKAKAKATSDLKALRRANAEKATAIVEKVKARAKARAKATVAAAPAASVAPTSTSPRPKRSASCTIAWGDCPRPFGISGPRD